MVKLSPRGRTGPVDDKNSALKRSEAPGQQRQTTNRVSK